MAQNKYTEKQKLKLQQAYLWNSYLKERGLEEPNLESFKLHCIGKKPWLWHRALRNLPLPNNRAINIEKLKDKFNRANQKTWLKNLIGVFQFMQDDLERGMSYAIEENINNINLPQKIKLQLKYISTELKSLNRSLEKHIPAQYRELDDFYEIQVELEEKLKNLKSKKSKP